MITIIKYGKYLSFVILKNGLLEHCFFVVFRIVLLSNKKKAVN